MYVITNIARLLYQFILKRRLFRNTISTIFMTNKLHGLEFVEINSYLSLIPRKCYSLTHSKTLFFIYIKKQTRVVEKVQPLYHFVTPFSARLK